MDRNPQSTQADVAPERSFLVLVIEDDANMRTFARIALSSHGYRTEEAQTAAEGIRCASKFQPDAILLDLGLPDADGAEVIRRVREWSSIPILVISARHDEGAKVKMLDEGADDYLTKPFGASEMVARIRAALRNAARWRNQPASVVHIGDEVHVDLRRHVVVVRGKEVHLAPMPFALLATLVRNAGRVMTHGQLLEEVWGPGHGSETPALRVYMAQLRQKLERKPSRPRHLLTETGIGYRLRLDA